VYVETLQEIAALDDSRCMIYAGIWCPTSHYVVRNFLQHRQDRGFDLRNLEVMRDLFKTQYAAAAEIPANCYEGYANRAENTYQYVAGLDLSQYGE
jgi:hypothetical protein